MSMMTPEIFESTMQAIRQDFGGDPEAAHSKADDLLCDFLRALGYGAGIDIYESMDKWYA